MNFHPEGRTHSCCSSLAIAVVALHSFVLLNSGNSIVNCTTKQKRAKLHVARKNCLKKNKTTVIITLPSRLGRFFKQHDCSRNDIESVWPVWLLQQCAHCEFYYSCCCCFRSKTQRYARFVTILHVLQYKRFIRIMHSYTNANRKNRWRELVKR